jgi:SAM-dependent methyltransferase
MGIFLHQTLIEKIHASWNRKPLLRKVYGDFYSLIVKHLSPLPETKIVELGSGLGSIKETIPSCIRTDLFSFPWIDQIENAYDLSFEDSSVSDLIMIDVFHHLQFPGNALAEFYRVLQPGGRVIMLEPYISALGSLVYGPLHAEPIGLFRDIEWMANSDWSPEDIEYYSAQGNATRTFFGKKYRERLNGWNTIRTIRLSALAYAASGGYSKPQFYPTIAFPIVKRLERILDLFPGLFATRTLIVLGK